MSEKLESRKKRVYDRGFHDGERSKEKELESLRAKLAVAVDGLESARDHFRNLPSGADEEADINNKSPEDAGAWEAGVAVQGINEALKKIRVEADRGE